MKIERQLKEAKGNRYETNDSYTRGVGSKSTLQSKVVSKTQNKGEASISSKQP